MLRRIDNISISIKYIRSSRPLRRTYTGILILLTNCSLRRYRVLRNPIDRIRSSMEHSPCNTKHLSTITILRCNLSTVSHECAKCLDLSNASTDLSVPSNAQPNPPSSAYYPNSRARANTMNNMDAIPPALARLQHMNHDAISGRNALTPVLNREEDLQKWERRQTGKPAATQPYPQLEYLQQQAELAAAGGLTNWNQPRRYQAQPSSLSHSYQPPSTIVVDEPDRRDAILSSVRSAARSDQGPQSLYGPTNAANLASPPQAYAGGAQQATRYAGSYSHQPSASSFDAVDRRADMSNLYVPMQPDQYQPYGSTSGSSPSHHDIGSQHRVTANAVPSFYGAGVVPSGGTPSNAQRNPFTTGTQNPVNSSRDSQRSNGMDMWPR